MRRRLNSIWSAESTDRWKIPYLDILVVGTIQFLLSLLILCYGVYLMRFVLEDLYTFKTGLWTAITFVASYKITNPWTRSYCKHLDNTRHRVHKRNITIITIFLCADLVTVSFLNTPITQITLYGALGGTLSSIVHIHAKFASDEVFKSRPRLYDTLDQIMKALNLITLPHLVLFLSNQYDASNSLLILAAVILHVIPACLLITTKPYQKLPLCKFQTVDKLSIEMVDLNRKTPIAESSSDDDENEEEVEESEVDITVTEPVQTEPNTNVQAYFQNVGVKILPNIPEEDEAEDDDDINEISSKRLSKISAILLELNENINKDVTLSVNNLFQPDEILQSTEPKEEVDFAQEIHRYKPRGFSIHSNAMSAMSDFHVQKDQFRHYFKEHFIESIPRTLGQPCFYPAIISSGLTTTLSTIIMAAAPYTVLVKSGEHTPVTIMDATFLLTVIGFSWIFFLAGYPVFSKISSFKLRLLFLIGLSISGLSLFVAQKISYDSSTLFALMFGLGHGIVSYTENIAYEDFFGEENWKKLQAPLEITTGVIVILVYLIIYTSSLEIDVLFRYAYWPYIAIATMWTLAFIMKRIVHYFKNIRQYNRDIYSDFNF